jgi:multidrug efflux pump
MEQFMNQMVNLVDETVPEAEGILSITSPGFGSSSTVNSGFIWLMLTDAAHRERSQQEIAADLSRQVTGLTAARTFVIQAQSIGSRGASLPVQYVLEAPNFEKLRETLPVFVEEAGKDPTFQYVDVDLKFNKPELRIEIDRERARTMGVAVVDIAQTLQLALSGQRFDYFIMNGKQYQVIGQLARGDRDEPLDLKSITVRNRWGQMVQLDNLVSISEQSSPPQRYRFNRFVSATVSAGLAEGKTIGDGIEAMDKIAARVLDDTFGHDLAGASRDFMESSSSLEFAFVLALLIVYLVLAGQFESFRDPFIIMFTVPLAMAGALLSLWYFNQTINIFSQIGQIMLVGLVTKNGILIVEFANQRKAAGMSKLESIVDASVTRLRPILMTSFSTILGTLPIALALGSGSESRIPMGIAVIGGLVFSTILSLFIVPAIYLFISRAGSNISLVDMDEQELEKIENIPA